MPEPTCKMFQSHPDSAVPKESPLAWSYQHVGLPKTDRQSTVLLHEHAFLGHLLLRGGAIALDKALRSVLNMSLPARPLSLTEKGDYSVQWLTPDEWLLIVPQGQEFETERKLREQLQDEHYAIVNVSGGQTLFTLTGKNVLPLLMKSAVYDVHPANFPAGKSVTTVFANTPMVLRRPDEERWELVVRRSFADYIFRWLLDAGAEYGINVSR
ncbi:sarcosine oxidase subunit gamma [Kalamiella sp. sgz302252]|uniref:sarcosine oxidase subunit gamma n=1 Tax=Pantoea sp. sgz302252 TaxID=3341827 RepID=UPI0036D30EA0